MSEWITFNHVSFSGSSLQKVPVSGTWTGVYFNKDKLHEFKAKLTFYEDGTFMGDVADPESNKITGKWEASKVYFSMGPQEGDGSLRFEARTKTHGKSVESLCNATGLFKMRLLSSFEVCLKWISTGSTIVIIFL